MWMSVFVSAITYQLTWHAVNACIGLYFSKVFTDCDTSWADL